MYYMYMLLEFSVPCLIPPRAGSLQLGYIDFILTLFHPSHRPLSLTTTYNPVPAHFYSTFPSLFPSLFFPPPPYLSNSDPLPQYSLIHSPFTDIYEPHTLLTIVQSLLLVSPRFLTCLTICIHSQFN